MSTAFSAVTHAVLVSSAGAVALASAAFGLLGASAGAFAASRARAALRAQRLALERLRTSGAVQIEAARRIAEAARASVDAVRDELARGAAALAPAVDTVLIYEERDGELRCVFACGERVAYFPGSRIASESDTLPVRALRTGHHVLLGEGMQALHPGDAAALAVPLALDQGRRACAVFAARSSPPQGSLERVALLAEQIAPAYRLALDREEDRRRAEYDGLTGLLAPRAFRRQLTTLLERGRFAPAERLALLFVDSDRFKEWNDAYGHASGDALLRELARELRSAATAPGDLVARNGGDEFCLVFTETGKADAIERAERLRRRIAALDLTPMRPPHAREGVHITASIGVAAFPADATSAHELLERADGAMYHSKRTGRDGVSYADGDRFVRLGGPAAAATRLETRGG